MAVDRNTPFGESISGPNYMVAVNEEVAALWNGVGLVIDNVAGSNTITGTVTPTLDAYVKGQMYHLVPAENNTGAATLNIDSRGAKAIRTAAGAALAGGELQAGRMASLVYDGAAFRLSAGVEEVGTFTPTFTFVTAGDLSVTYAKQIGRYLRVGSLVWMSCRIEFTPTYTTASGIAEFQGLPFTAVHVTDLLQAVSISWESNVTWGAADKQHMAYIVRNFSVIRITVARDSLSTAHAGTGNFPSGTTFDLAFAGAYRT